MKRLFPVLVGGLAVLLAATTWLAPAQQRATSAGRIAALEARVLRLEQRVQALKDTDALENLQNAYGYYVDKRLWDEVAALFTADARYELAQRGVFIGRDRIRKLLDVFGPAGIADGQLYNHIQMQPLIHVDGTTARMRVRALTQAGTYGGSGMWGEGIYENTYRKEDGVWKIANLHFYVTVYTPYQQGWGKAVVPADTGGVQAGFEPDLPPTETYGFYPDVYIPPFHYTNPVTGRPGTGMEDVQ